MSLEGGFLFITPEKELEFRRPFNTVVRQTLLVKNTHPTSSLAFKVKTTAPKSYCVRPNSGKLSPNGSLEVAVLLQPQSREPEVGEKCKDKFLVQAVLLPSELASFEGEDFNSLFTSVWSKAEELKKSGGPDTTAEKKLRVNYLPPLNTSSTTTLTTAPITTTPATTAPSPTAITSTSPPAASSTNGSAISKTNESASSPTKAISSTSITEPKAISNVSSTTIPTPSSTGKKFRETHKFNEFFL